MFSGELTQTQAEMRAQRSLPRVVSERAIATFDPADGHDITVDREGIFHTFLDRAAREQKSLDAARRQVGQLSYEASAASSRLSLGFDRDFANAPILLNGQRVVFNKEVPTTPVALEPKTKHRRGSSNDRGYRPY